MAITKEELKQIVNEILEEQKAALTIPECARYSSIGKDKIRELIAKENTDFPFFKVGVKTLINKSEFDKWLKKVAIENRQL